MNNSFIKSLGAFYLIVFMFSSCSDEKEKDNQLTETEKKEGWVLLFDGNSTEGWHLYNKGKIASAWKAKNGELFCNAEDSLLHGDLISDKAFENFDLRFDWKIPRLGNSGVFINVLERADIPYAWASAPEYQMLEKEHPDYGKNPVKQSGAIFGLASQINPVESKPTGEWNQSRIKQSNGKIEFYLNDVLTVQQDLSSQAWADTISKSGFKDLPEFGKHTKGHIGLQFWSRGISFRNVKIKEL
jgi:hypothetical protein